MSVSHRGILDFLRDEYGIPRSAVEQVHAGSGHIKLRFEHAGRPRTITLPSSPSDANWEMIKRHDIRHELGPAPVAGPTADKRRLEDMTAELKVVAPAGSVEADTITMPGSMSLRRTNKTLAFNVPDQIRDRFVRGGETVVVEFRDPNAWVIRHGDGPRFWPKEKGGLVIGGARYLAHFGGYFRRHPARYTLIRDVITVEIDGLPQVEGAEKPPAGTTPPERPEEALPRPAEQAEAGPPAGVAARRRTSSSEDDMRAVLALAREIEAASPYRLTRVRRGDEDVLVWRAPTIE